jgi:hypothetical protein
MRPALTVGRPGCRHFEDKFPDNENEKGAAMRFAIICLIGLSVLASPCAYDTDPRDPAVVAAITAKAFSRGGSPEMAAAETRPHGELPATSR